MEDTIKKWLADGDAFVAIYENQAMDSENFGHRIGIPWYLTDFNKLELGSGAPDAVTFKSGYGAGWKYVCIGKAKTVEEAMAFFNKEEK